MEFLHLGEDENQVHFSSRLWDFVTLSAVTSRELVPREVDLIVVSATQSPILKRLELCITASQMLRIFEASPVSQINGCTREVALTDPP